ncbi:phage tail assembly protein [Candidatus Uabimicrobium sp. HlEnr_7]|uniref:phage tail assembly protein n=1 Tax=Candidatus Uabimicrobium helgolandensis TaxID=3095367 RepID=UPI003556D989
MDIATQFEFSLPMGYVDNEGVVHKNGVIRLATAADEIFPNKNAKVKTNPSYLPIVLLSRVIVELGTVDVINTNVIENLFTKDFTYLQDLYNRLNEHGEDTFRTKCPNCSAKIKVDVPSLGE